MKLLPSLCPERLKIVFLILDDLKARQLADELKLKYTGSIGILILAKRKGLIVDIDEVISKIQTTNFRISNAIINKLKSA